MLRDDGNKYEKIHDTIVEQWVGNALRLPG